MRERVTYPPQIIHLKRFQFFNGRWVKSQRIVRFPTSNLDPLRFTAQNGNEPRAENGTETGSNHSQTDQEGARSSSPDTRPEESTNEDTTTPTLANGGRGHPGMIGDPPASPGSQLKQLDRSLHRREGNIYNLVAITVSLHDLYMDNSLCVSVLPPMPLTSVNTNTHT